MESNVSKSPVKRTRKKKIVVACVFIAVLLSIYAVWRTPNFVFYRTFHFSLPASSQTIKSDYSLILNSFSMKIKLNKDDVEQIEGKLREYYHDKGLVSDLSFLPHHENSINWWDMKENEIIYAHQLDKEGRFVKTAFLESYIAEKNGQYYLYIDQYE